VPLLQPPSYRHRFSIQATLGAAGRYLATASVDLRGTITTSGPGALTFE
jgi:hypothetical protein